MPIIGSGNDTYTQLLAPLNNSATDISQNGFTITNNGVTFSNSSPIFPGTYYAVFDGTDDYLSVPDNAVWTFGTANFTIDLWLNMAVMQNEQGVFSKYIDTNNKMSLYFNGSGQIGFYILVSGVTYASYQSGGYTLTSSWNHMALVRSGTNLYLFVNGVNTNWTASTAISNYSIPDISAAVEIGKEDSGGTTYYLNGAISEFMISTGIARWTSNFTPPALPYGSSRFLSEMSLLGTG